MTTGALSNEDPMAVGTGGFGVGRGRRSSWGAWAHPGRQVAERAAAGRHAALDTSLDAQFHPDLDPRVGPDLDPRVGPDLDPRVGPGIEPGTVDLALVTGTARPRQGLPQWKLLALTDAAAGLAVLAAVAVLAAGSLRATPAAGGDTATGRAVFVAVTWISLLVALAAKRIYAQARRHLVTTAGHRLAPLAEALVLAALVVLAADTLVGPHLRQQVPPVLVLAAFGSCLVLLPTARSLALVIQAARGRVSSRVLVVGTGTVASDVAARLSRSRQVALVGFVDATADATVGATAGTPGGTPGGTAPHTKTPGAMDGTAPHTVPLLGGLHALSELCQQHQVDRVVVAFPRGAPAAVTAQLRRLDQRVAVDVVPSYFELIGWDAAVNDLSGLPVVSLHDGPARQFEQLTKRLFDIVVASLGLVVVGLVLAPLALAVKLSSPGPVFFTQTRLGRGRVPFRIVKLRTMREAPDDPLADARPRRPGMLDTGRVTTVGRLLRRSGLDETPQLLNVLLGHMSLIGPRPFVPAECEGLPEWAEPRFDARPGVTGLWQVCGQHHLRFEELCRLDLLYVARWSWGTDLRILARTPGRLLRGGGNPGTAVAD